MLNVENIQRRFTLNQNKAKANLARPGKLKNETVV